MTNATELIKITTNESGVNCVSARELHEGLEVKERFQQWFNKRVSKYGFEENVDFTSVKSFTLVNNNANRELQDYIITVDMAKELCMVQNNDLGRKFRKYFIECEKKLQEVNSKANLLLMIYEGGKDAVTASKQLAEIEVKEAVKPLEIELDKNKEWYSIKRVTKLIGGSYDWRKLKQASEDHGYDIERVFGKNYGTVNAYHVDVWNDVYPDIKLPEKESK